MFDLYHLSRVWSTYTQILRTLTDRFRADLTHFSILSQASIGSIAP